MTTRPRVRWNLTGDDIDELVAWFKESYDEGWRPTLQSHVRGKEMRWTSITVRTLREKLASFEGERMPTMDAETISALPLPPGTHATVLTDRDVVTGEQLAVPVVWADRPYDRCPRCEEPVGNVVDTAPVLLNGGAMQGGQLEDLDQKHGCGEWLAVSYAQVEDAPEAVLAAAEELAEQLRQELAAGRARIEAGLRRELAALLKRLAEPLEDDETIDDRIEELTTGSETHPGTYREGDEWLAWDYAPVDDGDPVTVYASEVEPAT